MENYNKFTDTIYFYKNPLNGKVHQAKIDSFKLDVEKIPATKTNRNTSGYDYRGILSLTLKVAGLPKCVEYRQDFDYYDAKINDRKIGLSNLYTKVDCGFIVNFLNLANEISWRVWEMLGKGNSSYLLDAKNYYFIDGNEIKEGYVEISGVMVRNNTIYVALNARPSYSTNPAEEFNANKIIIEIDREDDNITKNRFGIYLKRKTDAIKEFEKNHLVAFDEPTEEEPKIDSDLIRAGIRKFLSADVSGMKISGEITINGQLIVL